MATAGVKGLIAAIMSCTVKLPFNTIREYVFCVFFQNSTNAFLRCFESVMSKKNVENVIQVSCFTYNTGHVRHLSLR